MSVYITREMLWNGAGDRKREGADNILRRLVRPVARKWKRNQAISELHALTDRELRDIGIYRGEIASVVARLDDVELGLSRAAAAATRVSG